MPPQGIRNRLPNNFMAEIWGGIGWVGVPHMLIYGVAYCCLNKQFGFLYSFWLIPWNLG